MARKTPTLREQAEANVLAVRGSYDAPGFDACVAAELEEIGTFMSKRTRKRNSAPDKKLVKLLAASKRKVAAMTPRQRRKMMERQAESFAHQDKD